MFIVYLLILISAEPDFIFVGYSLAEKKIPVDLSLKYMFRNQYDLDIGTVILSLHFFILNGLISQLMLYNYSKAHCLKTTTIYVSAGHFC